MAYIFDQLKVQAIRINNLCLIIESNLSNFQLCHQGLMFNLQLAEQNEELSSYNTIKCSSKME